MHASARTAAFALVCAAAVAPAVHAATPGHQYQPGRLSKWNSRSMV